MPKKDKKPKPKKIRAVRAPRAPRVARPHTHIINVYTTPSTEQPFNVPFSSQTMPFTTSTQYVSPKPIPVKVEPKELTTQNVFQAPFTKSIGKPKINIGLDRRDIPLDVINLETSEAETSVAEKKIRGPYKSKGKGSTIEKHQIIGRNIQNEYVRGVEGYDERDKPVMMETGGMEFFTKNKI